MKPGDVYPWLDQGPALLLEEVDIPMPCGFKDLEIFLEDPDSWPAERGWKIKLLLTDEILDVHEDTLTEDFSFRCEGILNVPEC